MPSKSMIIRKTKQDIGIIKKYVCSYRIENERKNFNEIWIRK